MPKWLQVQIVATIWLVWAVFLLAVVPFIMSSFVNAGDPAFTRDDRAWLTENHPGGTYVSNHDYRVCDGGIWEHFDVRHNRYTVKGENGCWKNTP